MGRRTGDDDPPLTLAEAARWLDPPIPLLTLRRLVARNSQVQPVGLSRTGNAGKPARTYRLSHLLALHAKWFRGEVDDGP
jgi:hypothetical protein